MAMPREAEIRSRGRLAGGLAVVVGIPLLFIAGVLAIAWLYQSSVPPLKEQEVPGADPVARFRYLSNGKQESELFVQPVSGKSLSDLFDMSLFEDTKPGMTQAEFERRYGSKQFQAAKAVLEAGLEENRDSLGSVIWRPVYAYPKQGSGGIKLAEFVNPVIVQEIERTGFAGLLILTDSADKQRLFCTVKEGRIIKLRWLGDAA